MNNRKPKKKFPQKELSPKSSLLSGDFYRTFKEYVIAFFPKLFKNIDRTISQFYEASITRIPSNF